MVKFMECKFEDIVDWCKANNKVDWLKDITADYLEANEKKMSFLELRLAFYREFFPELAPKASKAKKPSMYDIIASL